MARLEEVFSLIRNGASIKQVEGAGGIPITRIETISTGEIDRDRFGYAGIEDIAKYRSFLLHDGDILMSHINSEKHLGKVALYQKVSDEQIIHGMNLLVLRPNASVIDKTYAIYALRSDMFLRQIPSITKKSVNQASFTISALKELEIPLFDLPTQRRIAATLDKVSEGIALCKQMLADLDELVKSQFVEMFGRPEDWSDGLEYLGDHIDLINGFAFLSENFSENGIPVIKIRNVNTADFSRGNMQYHPYDPSLKKYIVEPGDLLISLTGTVGKEDFANVCLADNTYDTYYLNQRNAKLVPHEELTTEFLLHFLKYDYIKRKLIKQGTGVRQCHLHNKDINEIQLIIPSKDKQSEFAKVTHQSDKSKFAVQQQLAGLETLKKSLMQEYFGYSERMA